MVLQGTFDTFSLPEVLQLLAATRKTGYLDIDGDRGRGSVWVHDGSLVAARTDRTRETAEVHEALFELLRYHRGQFTFAVDDPPADLDGHGQDVGSALRSASQLLDEWRQIEEVVPSLVHRVVMAPELPAEEISLDAEHWKTVVAIAGGLSVGELGQTLGLGEFDVSRVVSELVDLGVAVVMPPGSARVPSARHARTAEHAALGHGNGT